MKLAVRIAIAVLLVALAIPAGTAVGRQLRADPEGCEYQWTGSAWTLVDSNCPNGHCEPPIKNGTFIGQTVYRACTPNPAAPCGCQ